jgi:hypothetical protein
MFRETFYQSLADAAKEKFIVSSEIQRSAEKIVERKTIVYETRVDPAVIKLAGEKLKDQLFAKFGFLKPKPEEVQLISIDKYYEPYLMISGVYSIDYYRKCLYPISVDKQVLEVALLNQQLKPEQSNDPSVGDHNVIKLEGEERLVNEAKASVVLDRFGEDVTLEKLPSAPSEKNPKKILAAFGAEEIPENADVDMIRSRIFKRPKGINRTVDEVFEISERAVIYTPRFRVFYRNSKSNEEREIEFDGVTGERLQQKKQVVTRGNLPVPPPPPPPA